MAESLWIRYTATSVDFSPPLIPLGELSLAVSFLPLQLGSDYPVQTHCCGCQRVG